MDAFLLDEGLQQALHQAVLLAALVAARLLPMVYVVPFLGGPVVPHTVKMGLALALTILVYPAVWFGGGAAAIPDDPMTLGFLILKELFVGFTLGYVCALSFDALRIAGQIIDNTAGLTQATTLVPQLPDRISPTSNFLYQLGIVIFFAIGGHALFLWALMHSFEVLPPTEFFAVGAAAHEAAALVLDLTARAIALGVLLSFPVLATTFLVNLFLALVNRSAPQINVFFLGMPLKAVLSSAVVLLSLEVLLGRFSQMVLDDLEALLTLIELTGGAP